MKPLLRFVLILVLSRLLAPRLNLLFHRLSARVPPNSFVADVLAELSGTYSTSIIRSFGETAGDVVFGSTSKRRR